MFVKTNYYAFRSYQTNLCYQLEMVNQNEDKVYDTYRLQKYPRTLQDCCKCMNNLSKERNEKVNEDLLDYADKFEKLEHVIENPKVVKHFIKDKYDFVYGRFHIYTDTKRDITSILLQPLKEDGNKIGPCYYFNNIHDCISTLYRLLLNTYENEQAMNLFECYEVASKIQKDLCNFLNSTC